MIREEMAIKMAPSRYFEDSDSDLPELDELISQHVKGLTLNAPKLNASKTTAPRLAPQKSTGRSTKTRSETTKTNASTKNAAKPRTLSRPLTELKTAPELRRPEPKIQPKPRAQVVQKKAGELLKEPKIRATPHRRARPILVPIEDSESEESQEEVEEQDVEESIYCESDKEDQPPVLAPRATSKPRRRLVAGRRTPAIDSSDSEEDVFHTPPSESARKPSKETFTSKNSDDLTQKLLQLDLDGSDKENDNLAILKFSPPRAARPIMLERPATPPPASPTKSKLVSPSKKKQRIPTPPHAPNFEDFWNVHAVNTWNDEYSPQKPLMSPKKNRKALQDDSDSPSASPKKTTSPTKKTRAAIDAKKDFENKKHKLVEDFFAELDTKITDGKIGELATLTGGVKFIWSKTLNSTAGRANWKRETTKHRNLDGTTSITQKHHASIELAEKVIDDEERLLNVVAHEFCHLANFMVSGIKDQPHGHQFKVWGRKCSEAFGHRGVEVTTKHSYHIDYKYVWTCTNEMCSHEFKRHSKSIDPARQSCGVCRSKLAQTKPAPRKQAGPTTYAAFVKANFAGLKQEMAGAPHKEVMAALGQKYRDAKAKGELNGGTPTGSVDGVTKALEVVILDSD
ncbi:hypothetical protein D6D00_08558 [Aureobasidium pullulans]|nr:hypothetical protein D6D26_03613 [Aureobasidium pullulans]THY17253.1 hypothetical protein D6D00_08558 [Aureobasidium pullulans]